MAQKKRSRYDELHDKYHSLLSEKAGTRYERLAAIIFKKLDTEGVVIHDLKLRGGSGVKHQIDVTIEKQGVKQRTLIECKDFDTSDKKVGLGIVRDFYGVFADLQPQEAWVVTCKGFTKPAIQYAQAMGIKLAILREFEDSDWDGRGRTIKIDSVLVDVTKPRVQLCLGNEQEIEGLKKDFESHDIDFTMSDKTQPIYLHLPQSGDVQLNDFVKERMKDSLERAEGPVQRGIKTPGAAISVDGGHRHPVEAVTLEYEIRHVTETTTVGGDKIGCLLLQVIGGESVALWEEDIKAYRFIEYELL